MDKQTTWLDLLVGDAKQAERDTRSTVMKLAAGEAKKKMASATSSGRPMRHRGVSSARASRSSWARWAFMSVAMTPGATQFTRM